jgi:hypothetical protein
MLDFLIIFAAALSGFVHAPVWVVVVAAGGLFAMSYWRHADIYERGLGLGLIGLMQATAWRSGMHGLVASGVAFGGGLVIRLATWG